MVLAHNPTWTQNITEKDGSTRASSSTMIDSEMSSTGIPPYFSGTVTPCKPSSRNCCHSSEGGVCVWSRCSTVGARTVSAKSRTISRIMSCSSVVLKSKLSPLIPKRGPHLMDVLWPHHHESSDGSYRSCLSRVQVK